MAPVSARAVEALSVGSRQPVHMAEAEAAGRLRLERAAGQVSALRARPAMGLPLPGQALLRRNENKI